jgi:hypothetical protein
MGVNERFPDLTTVILVLAGGFPAHVVSLRQNACACIDLVAERVYSRRRPRPVPPASRLTASCLTSPASGLRWAPVPRPTLPPSTPNRLVDAAARRAPYQVDGPPHITSRPQVRRAPEVPFGDSREGHGESSSPR